jgi:hypothetical protein
MSLSTPEEACCPHSPELHRVPGSAGLCYGRTADDAWCPCLSGVIAAAMARSGPLVPDALRLGQATRLTPADALLRLD